MLTRIEINEIQLSMQKQRADLLKRLNKETSSTDLDIMNPDRSELAVRYSQKQREILLIARAEQQLKEIDLALKRIDEGTYSTCKQCGQPINPSRLMTMPAVAVCITCKSRSERR